MNLRHIVAELKREQDDLNREQNDITRAIAALEEIGGKQPIKHRRLSIAGRRRISEAMKKRWQERRAKVSIVRKTSKAA